MKTGNEIGDEGAKMISEGMKSNSTLTSLDLGGEEEKQKEERRQIKKGEEIQIERKTRKNKM